MTQHRALWFLAGLPLILVGILMVLPPYPQPPAYHRFADQRMVLGIPNGFDVLSNLPFCLIGILGLRWLRQPRRTGELGAFLHRRERMPYVVFFLSVSLVGLGSIYYHLAPDTPRLVWDRLPIAGCLMALIAAAVVDRVSLRAGLYLLPPLLVVGVGSVMSWYWSELQGRGALLRYLGVHAAALLAALLLVLCCPSRYTRGADLGVVLALYGGAKVAEGLDTPLFALGHIMSGHTLKHLLAAGAVYWVLHMLQRRQPASASAPPLVAGL